MKKEKHLEINENNYSGYVELYASKEKGWIVNDKTITNILTVTGVLFVVVLYGVPTIILSATSNVELALASALSVAVADIGYIFSSIKSSEKKAKLQIKEKYPYIDLSLDMMEVEKALKEAKVLVYKENYLLLDVKSYEQRLKFEKEIKKELEKQDNNENLDELIKDSEQKIKDNTDSMEEYKANIKQEKIRLEALKRIKQERENQAFSEEKNNIEIPSQEKGLVLRTQKED